MSSPSLKCYLKSATNLHEPIELTAEQKFIGRSPETLIADAFCSRHQVALTVDFSQKCVLIKQIGLNKSALNGLVLDANQIYKAYDGDRLEVLHDKYFHEIKFDDESNSIKRNALTEINICKKVKLEPENVKPNTSDQWESIDSGKLLIFTSKGVVSGKKIASYDIDGTIIKTKSGNVFAKNIDDWQLAFPEVPGILKAKLKEGFKIVFFTNQAGIASGKTKESDFKKKLENIVRKLNIPVQAFVSTCKGPYRKPLTGMWDALNENKNDGIVIEKKDSFFVGDAAGRPEKKSVKRKKDHSLVDRLMAMNIGLTFYTPEQHFQNVQEEAWIPPEFNPQNCSTELYEPKNAKLTSSELEVIIMVGGPGSGKSYFAQTYLAKQYTIINRDTLKTWQKCAEMLEECLNNKRKAVIDNTNPDKESRKRFIEIAKKRKVNCRCFLMNTSYHQSKHNNVFRELTDSTHQHISDMIINTYKKKYQEPHLNEGFSEIVRINVVPKFQNEKDEKLYKMYLLEK